MDTKSKIIIVLLILSVSLNVYGIIRTDKLERELTQEMNALSDMTQGSINSLSGRVSSVASQLAAMVREQEWMLNREFSVDMEKSSAGEVYLSLDFTLREVAEDAQAQVHYRVADSQDWTAVDAEAMGGNTFRAELVVSGENEYRYKIQVGDKVDEEVSIPRHYYVSRPVIPEIAGIGSEDATTLDLLLVSSGVIFNPPAKISLKFYDHDRLVRTEVLYQGDGSIVHGDNPPWYGPHTIQFEHNLTHVDLEVLYEDGTTDEGEIWPGFEYMENLKSKGY